MGHPNMYQDAVQPQAPQNDVWTADDWDRWRNRWSQAEWERWKWEQEQKRGWAGAAAQPDPRMRNPAPAANEPVETQSEAGGSTCLGRQWRADDTASVMPAPPKARMCDGPRISAASQPAAPTWAANFPVFGGVPDVAADWWSPHAGPPKPSAQPPAAGFSAQPPAPRLLQPVLQPPASGGAAYKAAGPAARELMMDTIGFFNHEVCTPAGLAKAFAPTAPSAPAPADAPSAPAAQQLGPLTPERMQQLGPLTSAQAQTVATVLGAGVVLPSRVTLDDDAVSAATTRTAIRESEENGHAT